MLKTVVTLFLSISVSIAFAQTTKITNRSTGLPIADVFVFHENQNVSSISQENGEADLSEFPKSGHFIFQHPAFQVKQMTYERLSSSGFKVKLTERILEIDEVTVTANRWEQDKNEVSQDIAAISEKTISFQNPTTSADLLAESGQVFVQKSQLGGGSPMLRGFSANSVLLVVDGVRLNNAIYRSGNLQNIINIDPNALEGSEVIYGPGSVMYGSDAMGGVMDFHTKQARFTQLDKPQFSGNVFGRYSTAANEQTGHIDFSVSGQSLSYFGSVSYSDIGDLRAGSNRSDGYKGHFLRKTHVKTAGGADFLAQNEDENVQKSSGYQLINTIHKFKMKTGEKSDIGYGFYYSTTSDIPRYDRLSENITDTDSLVNAEWFYGPQKWMMHALTFNTYKTTAAYNEAKVTAAYQSYEESRNDRDFGASRLRTRAEHVDLFTITADFDKEFANSSLYYGLDFFYNDVQSDAYREHIITGEQSPTASRYPNGGSQYYTSAIYANYVHRLGERWTLNVGSRFSDVRLEAKTMDASAGNILQDNISLSNRALNGMGGVIYNHSANTRWKLLLSSGFRAPNVDDVGKLFEVDNEVIVVPNPELEPEFSYNQELGFQQKVEKLKIDLVGFHSYLTNAIVRGEYTVNGASTIELDGETKAVRAQVNADEARIFGASARLDLEINPALAATTSFTFTEGYELSSREPLRHIPPMFGKLSIIHQSRKFKTEFYSQYNLTKVRNDIASSEIDDKPHLYTDTGTPGWITFNVKTQYILSQTFTAQLGLENILDTHYRPYSSGISAPGRNLIIALRARI